MAEVKTFVRNPEIIRLVRLPHQPTDDWTILSVDDGDGPRDPSQDRMTISAKEVSEMYTEKVDRRTRKPKDKVKIIGSDPEELPEELVDEILTTQQMNQADAELRRASKAKKSKTP